MWWSTRSVVLRHIDTPHDVGVALGARVFGDGRVSTVVRQRLDAMAALVDRGNVVTVVLSGDGSRAAHDEPATMRQWLNKRGVSDDIIELDDEGWSTAVSCRHIATRVGQRRVVIATQDFVAPRTAFLAVRAGLVVTVWSLPTRGHYQRRVLIRLMIREIPACWKALLGVSQGVDGWRRRRVPPIQRW
jgi:vancomycin permeability regulator SanA